MSAGNSTQSVTLSAADIRRRVNVLAEKIRDRDLAPEFERERRLPVDIVDDLRAAGVFRMNMPAAWGGPEVSSPEQVEIVEALSRADGSVGWCSFIWADSGIYSGYLDETAARKLYPRLDVAQSGWIYPAGRAERVSGGFRVSGRWGFGSGCNHCDVLAAGCTLFEDGEPLLGPAGTPRWRVMLAPRESYHIEDTWFTTGLRGTGSNDYLADDLFIPEDHSFSLLDASRRTGPLWKRPDTFLRKMSGVPLGIARDAIDRAVDILKQRVDRVSKLPVRELRDVQMAVASAEGKLGAARSYVYSSLEDQWRKLERDEPLSEAERAATFLSRQFAFQASRQVVQLVYDTIGGAAVYASGPFDRQLRDMNTACQHIAAQEKTLASVGSLLLGVPGERGML